MKVKRIKEAFEKPLSTSRTSPNTGQLCIHASDKSVSSTSPPTRVGKIGTHALTRSPSPVWDIELDLNEPDVISGGHDGPRKMASSSHVAQDMMPSI